jgi:hypothetical protein
LDVRGQLCGLSEQCGITDAYADGYADADACRHAHANGDTAAGAYTHGNAA